MVSPVQVSQYYMHHNIQKVKFDQIALTYCLLKGFLLISGKPEHTHLPQGF